MKELVFEEMLEIIGGKGMGSHDYHHPSASGRGVSSGHEAYKRSNEYAREHPTPSSSNKGAGCTER